MLAALIPAIFAAILIFMDQQITAVIVNRKDNRLWVFLSSSIKLSLVLHLSFLSLSFACHNKTEKMPTCFQKGLGYHLDLCVLCGLIAICSLTGIPWFVASTVPSISHVQSLRVESSSGVAPGASFSLISVYPFHYFFSS